MEIEVVVGSYSHLVFGYFVKPNEEQKLKFSQSFTSDSHLGAVKCMAVSKKGILATGSSDDNIKLFKLTGKRTEIGSLTHHSGTITSLKFHESNLFSSSQDGDIAIWRPGSWECLKVLKHKAPVVDFTIHPSGKLLLSTCQDRTLCTWNLANGKRTFVVNLKDVGQGIQFSDDGNTFVVNCLSYASLYLTSEGQMTDTITPSSKIVSLAFFKSNILLLGLESGVVLFYNTKKSMQIFELNTKTKRVKGIAVVGSKFIIASSDGYIKLYDVEFENHERLAVTFVTGIVSAQRWLCTAAFQPTTTAKQTKEDKKQDGETKEDEEEEEKDNDDDNEEHDDGDDDDDEEDGEENESDDDEEEDGEEDEIDDEEVENADEGDDDDSDEQEAMEE